MTVRAAPERGKANRSVVKLLAGRLGLPAAAIRIVSGRSSPDKLVAVDGLTIGQLRERLLGSMAPPV